MQQSDVGDTTETQRNWPRALWTCGSPCAVVFSCRPRNSVNTPSRNLPFLIFSSRCSRSSMSKLVNPGLGPAGGSLREVKAAESILAMAFARFKLFVNSKHWNVLCSCTKTVLLKRICAAKFFVNRNTICCSAKCNAERSANEKAKHVTQF